MAVALNVLLVALPGREAVRAELERGGFDPVFHFVNTSEELIAALPGQWDIAISGFAPNTFGALEALRILQERNPDLPLIVVSGRIKDADVIALLKAGA